MARKSRRGADAIEFALVLPVFVLVIVGIMDFSWVFLQQSALDSSATIGCRAGALVDPGIGEANMALVESTAQAALVQALKESGGGDCTDCTTVVTAYGTNPGRSIECEVSRDFEPLIGMVVSPMTMTSNMVVRLEWQRG